MLFGKRWFIGLILLASSPLALSAMGTNQEDITEEVEEVDIPIDDRSAERLQGIKEDYESNIVISEQLRDTTDLEEEKVYKRELAIEEKRRAIRAEKERKAKEAQRQKEERAKKESKDNSKSQNNTTKQQIGRSMTFESTAYTDDANSQGKWVGQTATGRKPQVGVVAVDPNVIPLGTKLIIEGYNNGNVCVAGDVGGAIKGNMIDVFLNSRAECRKWGRRQVKVQILQ